MMNNLLAKTLSLINNAERAGKREVIIRPTSKLVIKVLQILKKNKYIKGFKEQKDMRGNQVKIELANKINKIGVIRPKFSVKIKDLEKFEKRYLPAKDFGLILISTSKKILTHMEAKQKKTGGVLLAYVY